MNTSRIRGLVIVVLLLALSNVFAQFSCTDCLVEFKTATADRPKVGEFAYVYNNLPKREVYKTYTYNDLWEENYDGDSGTSKDWSAEWEQEHTTTYDPDDFTWTAVYNSSVGCFTYTTTPGVTNQLHVTRVFNAADGSHTETNVIATYNFSTMGWDYSCRNDFFHDPNSNCHYDMSLGGLTKVTGTASDNSPTDTATTRTTITSYARYSGYERTTTITETLSDEYTTDELLSKVNADLDTALASASWASSGLAYRYMADSEACVDAGKMIYRFKLPATEKDSEYIITWQEVLRRDDGSSTSTDMSETVVGDGGVVYGIEHTPDVPQENGDLTVENVAVELSPNGMGGSNGSNPPGSGNVGNSGGGGADCGSCSGIVGGGGGRLGSGAQVSLSMGKTGFGHSAGTILIRAATPSPMLATPASMFFNLERSDVDVVRVEDSIRQIKTFQVLADVITVTDYKFEVRFYDASDVGAKTGGLYPLISSPTPFVTWRIENPDASPTVYNKLKITEIRGAVSKVYEYTYTSGSNHTWVLSKPGSLQEEELIWSTTTGASATRETTLKLRKPSGSNELVLKRKYQEFTWGEGLVEETIGDGGAAQTTAYTYSTGSSYGSARPLEKVEYPDGSWIWYTYTGENLPYIVYSSYGNQGPTTTASLCRSTQYDYSSPSGSGDDSNLETRTPRRIDDYVLGQHVGRRYTIITASQRKDIVCQTVSALWNATDNLVTTTVYYTSGVNDGRIKSIAYPDGTMEFYTYSENGPGTEFTTTVSRGDPNSGLTAIEDGVTTTTVINEAGELISRTQVDVLSTKTIMSETYSNFDEFDRPQRTQYLDGKTTEVNYSCCGIDNTLTKDGLVTSFTYDDLNRQITSLAHGILYTNILDSVGNVVGQIRKGTDNSSVTLEQTAYDNAGRATTITNALGGVTTFAYAIESSRRKDTTTYPDTGVRYEYYFRDGQLEKVYGDATTSPVRNVYGVELHDGAYREYQKQIRLTAAGSDTSEWTKTYFDALGRSFKTLYADATTGTEADNPYSLKVYNSSGQLEKTVDPDGVITLYAYNARGELVRTVEDLDQDSVIDTGGTDRIRDNLRGVGSYSSTDVLSQTNYVFTTNSSATTNIVGITRRAADGLKSWNSVFRDQSTEVITSGVTVYSGSGVRTETTTFPDGASVVKAYSYGRLSSITRKNSTGGQVTKTTYGYDPHGRVSSLTDDRNGATTYTFNNADQVLTTTSPVTDSGLTQQTTMAYDTSGRTTTITNPDASVVHREYYKNGLLKKTYGARTYPIEYTYDDQGRMATMKTWKNYSGSSGTAVTTWNYDVYRGWLLSKDYANPSTGAAGTDGPTYTYTAGGRLKTRVWDRGTTTTYKYGFDDTTSSTDDGGDLVKIDYSDTTADITHTYARNGRRATSVRNSMTTTFTYNDVGQLLTESHSGGSLDGLSVTSTYDADLKRVSLTTKDGVTILDSGTFTYDNAGRSEKVSSDGYNVTYSYVTDSTLVGTITFETGTTDRLVTTKNYDRLNRLSSIASVSIGASAASLPLSYSYNYNQANQRVRRTDADGAYWIYAYDELGQVVSGNRYWADATPVDGQQFTYGFDDIGNREDTGGRASALSTYTSNYLNQYSQRTVADKVDVHGIANPTASVTVNSNTATRKGEYFHYPLTVNNSSAAQYPTVTVTSNYGGTQSSAGEVYVPKTAELFTHDDDGNLTADGRWTYIWDCENRLIEMKRDTEDPSGARLRMTFEYDHQGRRIRKRYYTHDGMDWVEPPTDTVYLYDGWNLVAELDAENGNAALRTYVWGSDLSGSEQGAGGVGGLLKIKDYTNTGGTKHYFVAYDGNGNVMGLVDAADGSVDANYEYGPFGEPLRATGTVAQANPIRWSSKYTDDESGLVYYGYRYYNPSTGRWLSRDPIEENGGEGLYAFVNNNAICEVDVLGLLFGRGKGYKVDKSDKTVSVDDGTVVVLYGHQALDQPWQFKFEGKCGAGGAIVCFPGLTNRKIKAIHQIGGMPTHDDWMYFYGELSSIPYTQKGIRRAGRDPNTDGDKLVENSKTTAMTKAKEICRRCCNLKEVKIEFYRSAKPFSLDIRDMNIPKQPKTIVVNCAPFKKK